MKIIFLSIMFFMVYDSEGQGAKKTNTPIQIVNRNFKIYISTADNSPSWKIRKEMFDALTHLQQSAADKDLPLLVNVWMYYDPTDFSIRPLIEPIFHKHQAAALRAVDDRIKHRKKWETDATAPYAELTALKQKLSAR